MSKTAQNNSDFLGTESIGKLLFKLALPAIAAQVINMLYNLVDRIYIGHIPEVGAYALTGVGVCMPIIMIVSAFAALVSMGSAPKASISMGKGDNKTAEKILGNSFSMLLIISVIITILLLIFQKDLLLLFFGASDNTIEYATSYMSIYAIGTMFVQLTLGLNAFISAQGFAKTSMLTVLIGAIINIILDPILIFGFEMGVTGAALATILSQAVSCVWVLVFLFGKKTILKIRAVNMKLKKDIVLPCLALGLAPFIMQSTESLVAVTFNSNSLKYGGDIAVGAMTILTSVMQFSMLPLQGLSQGAGPITSYNFGAKNVSRVKKSFFMLLKCCGSYAFVLWGAVMLFPEFFIGIFTPDAALIAFTSTPLRIFMCISVLFSAQMACQMTFISIGNAKASVFVALLRKVILLVPLIYILPLVLENQVMAVYIAEPIADLTSVIITIIFFYFQFKKSLKSISKGEFNELESVSMEE